MVSILDTLQKKKTGKRDKLFLIPIISIALSVLVFIFFLWQRNQDEKPAVIDEPFEMTTAEIVGERMTDDNDSFLLYLYADWCPYCKEAMFGDSEATEGYGTLLKWVDDYEPDMMTFFEREEDVEERSDDLDAFMLDLKYNILDGVNQDRWEWIGKKYEYDSGSYKLAAEQDAEDKTRPGVPGFITINDGYVTGYVAGGQSLTGFSTLYEQLVIDEDDCYQEGRYVQNGTECL